MNRKSEYEIYLSNLRFINKLEKDISQNQMIPPQHETQITPEKLRTKEAEKPARPPPRQRISLLNDDAS